MKAGHPSKTKGKQDNFVLAVANNHQDAWPGRAEGTNKGSKVSELSTSETVGSPPRKHECVPLRGDMRILRHLAHLGADDDLAHRIVLIYSVC